MKIKMWQKHSNNTYNSDKNLDASIDTDAFFSSFTVQFRIAAVVVVVVLSIFYAQCNNKYMFYINILCGGLSIFLFFALFSLLFIHVNPFILYFASNPNCIDELNKLHIEICEYKERIILIEK